MVAGGVGYIGEVSVLESLMEYKYYWMKIVAGVDSYFFKYPPNFNKKIK